MTLQEFISTQKVLVCEFDAFKSKTRLPQYHLSWSDNMWRNRWSGRTQLTEAEVFALGMILDGVRHPKEQTINLN